MAHQGAGASIGVVGSSDGDSVGAGLVGAGLLAGGLLAGLRDGVPLGRLLAGGVVGDGPGAGLVEVAPAEGAVERLGVGCGGGATRVGDGEAVADGEGLAAGAAEGGCHCSSTGSTKGMIVSGRTGPPAKLTPTIAVYATPARPRK
ncbi:hypothetical protein [Micromonospora fluostatini]|uniref:hypothetical protein n=1 Tax=Micromonospora sp. JCM 30529 TaxID=3421643 RepID=UPI003D176BFA